MNKKEKYQFFLLAAFKLELFLSCDEIDYTRVEINE